ncbi:flagellar basal body-associated FliL family protein [Pseudohoeflea suaedae]|uniref:Flagellar protein FliL n=1 Tax=Pseudohoeflea suaedae TaxID=877384 RepID=A0A4R5PNW4_9HYPH|nr:flagellar basal body-associated FliL family protein [Pseudohoeflea suaedae]TDH38267.1 flagellar basal body-associated FliL family protein [Pseudohoeflea suaedae]
MSHAEIDYAAGDAPKKKGGLIVTLAAVLVLSLVGGGGGWIVGGMLAPEIKQKEEEAKQAQAGHGGGEEKATAEEEHVRPSLYPIGPITTNLSYPSDSWVRLELSLLFKETPDEALADRINEDILAYLRTVSLQQIEGPRGFEYLRDDIVERARLRSQGDVTDVIFRTFVIE